jgi:DNA repair exonuclease SbcCD ATPase subunit
MGALENQMIERLQTLQERKRAFSRDVGAIEGRVRQLRSDIDKNQKRMASLEQKKILYVKTSGILDRLIQVVAANGIGRIEKTVTKGLRAVFGKKISFVVEKKDGARGTSYRLEVKYGDVQDDPLETFGGGVVNVTAFLLRIIMVKRFNLAKFLALDESFNNVSEKYVEKVSQMLQILSKDYGYKIVLITHQPKFTVAADKKYEVFEDDGGPVLRLVDSLS